MTNYCHSYTVMEVKRLMDQSEGRGPGVGGHAIKEHGFMRADVTSRGKPKDSAFERGWDIRIKMTSALEDSVMKGVFDDYEPHEPANMKVKKMVHSSDQ